jgi:hypothetical protein
MIEEYLLPQKISDKYKKKFLKNTLKIGDDANFEGFIVSLPNAGLLKNFLWKGLSPLLGNFEVKGITPFPENGFPVLPIVIPHYREIKSRVAVVEGKIYDFSMFSDFSGRFLLVDSWERRRVEDYILRERTSLDGGKIYRIFDSSMPEVSRDVILPYFLSSAQYIRRTGGCTITLVDALSKYYSSDFGDIERMVRDLPSIVKRDTVKLTLMYDEEIEVKVSPSLRIKYGMMNEKQALKFYPLRRSRDWEKSAITRGDVKREKLIGSAELPFIAYQEETKIEDSEIREYALDMAIYVLEKHLEMPEIDENYIYRFKQRFLDRIQGEFPLISEAMRMGILIDMANVNGLGEHLGRLLNAWERLNYTNPEEKVIQVYALLFERIEDVLGDVLRKKLSALGERKRIERVLNRILWELNTLKPEGWDYFYFDKKAQERGIENPEKFFTYLLKEGFVIEKRKGIFYAVSSL